VRGGRQVKRCVRDGCYRNVTKGNWDHCSFMCKAVDNEMVRAQRVCDAVGPSAGTGELWAAVVEMSDAWTRFQMLDKKIYDAAREAGITSDQWMAIKLGEAINEEHR